MKNENKAKLFIIISMVILGTIGIFRRYIPLSSGIIAFTRGLIGTLFLVLTVVITRKKISFADIKKNLFLLKVMLIIINFGILKSMIME